MRVLLHGQIFQMAETATGGENAPRVLSPIRNRLAGSSPVCDRAAPMSQPQISEPSSQMTKPWYKRTKVRVALIPVIGAIGIAVYQSLQKTPSSFSSSGSGNQYNNAGAGNQYNNPGAGNQYNITASNLLIQPQSNPSADDPNVPIIEAAAVDYVDPSKAAASIFGFRNRSLLHTATNVVIGLGIINFENAGAHLSDIGLMRNFSDLPPSARIDIAILDYINPDKLQSPGGPKSFVSGVGDYEFAEIVWMVEYFLGAKKHEGQFAFALRKFGDRYRWMAKASPSRPAPRSRLFIASPAP